MTYGQADAAVGQQHPGHVVSLKVLFGVLGALLVLTVITVVTAKLLHFGSFNIVLALIIATTKASLVGLYFMHLRWDRPFHAVVLILALALVALFVGLALLDSVQYQPTLIPGYAPDMQR